MNCTKIEQAAKGGATGAGTTDDEQCIKKTSVKNGGSVKTTTNDTRGRSLFYVVLWIIKQNFGSRTRHNVRATPPTCKEETQWYCSTSCTNTCVLNIVTRTRRDCPIEGCTSRNLLSISDHLKIVQKVFDRAEQLVLCQKAKDIHVSKYLL